jgi:uncharacterized protein YbjT (DUF2867 family)
LRINEAFMGKSIFVTGASGTAGSAMIMQAIADSDIDKITAIVRKPLTITHPKLNIIIHQNFLNYADLTEIFKQHDACIWCLGISQSLVSKEEYIKLTYDYTLAAAEAMVNANPKITFVFLSGMGADSQEKSSTLFAWAKGKTENALKKMPFKNLYIARPGGIVPSYPRDNYRFIEKVMIGVVKLMKVITPGNVITSAELAKAMLIMVKQGTDKVISENKGLHKLLR